MDYKNQTSKVKLDITTLLSDENKIFEIKNLKRGKRSKYESTKFKSKRIRPYNDFTKSDVKRVLIVIS